ncbi:hypothetical protein HMI55_002206 [Coelomomyces lativittatus]|nr:hypothetical protein HMI56_005735 [Coelomomyces lativittatus]KAJ1504029.1 hypothetical protein HMI55_002206 [Coelomomyces lativittatus]
MSSGFSLHGSRPVCFPFFQELYICYATSKVDEPMDCKKELEDLKECRTHKNEYERIKTITEHQKEKTALHKPNDTSLFINFLSKFMD